MAKSQWNRPTTAVCSAFIRRADQPRCPIFDSSQVFYLDGWIIPARPADDRLLRVKRDFVNSRQHHSVWRIQSSTSGYGPRRLSPSYGASTQNWLFDMAPQHRNDPPTQRTRSCYKLRVLGRLPRRHTTRNSQCMMAHKRFSPRARPPLASSHPSDPFMPFFPNFPLI